MWISNMVSWRCYNTSDENDTSIGIQWWNFGYTYTFSQENTFYVIGCGDFGLLTARNKLENDLVSTGCLAYCSGPEDVTSGVCSGSGCCQTALPKDMYYYRTSYITFNNSVKINSTSSITCTYSFVGERDVFKFRGASDLNDSTFRTRIRYDVPRVLEWGIGNITCAQAQAPNRTDLYACQANSDCVDSKRISGGYRCKCKEGYSGNPYLQPGCQGD